MFCWGNTANGELGLGGIEINNVLSPVEIVDFESVNSIKAVACGKYHTLVMTEDGKLYTCGNNDYGQLGHDGPRTKLQPIGSVEPLSVISIACGENHSMALDGRGQLYTWGCNTQGQLGRINCPLGPRLVSQISHRKIAQICSGYNHCMALTNDGYLYTWGSNEYGQLGCGTAPFGVLANPTYIESLNGLPISFIACGGYHSFAVSKSGAVFGWGKNDFGQLGLNHQTNVSTPTQLKTIENISIKYISAGEDFSVFLTHDGGVFTCGAGMQGQLGHGTYSNEIVPRKVMELMGSTVFQISCGRKHTLALVPSKGRVYSFGLGSVGQLGTKNLNNSNIPQLVLGPWLSQSGILTKKTKEQYNVKSIHAGGDRCFVRITRQTFNMHPDDYRIIPNKSQILTLNLNTLVTLSSIHPQTFLDEENTASIRASMSSLPCLNGSFLVSNDSHYFCSRNNHGINFELANQCFETIKSIRHTALKQVILSSVAESIESLSYPAPNVESLRCYLTLPMYHGFNIPENSFLLQYPYSKALLNLKTEELSIINSWVQSMPDRHFENLIMIFKNLFIHQFNSCYFLYPQESLDRYLELSAHMLEKLNDLNSIGDRMKHGKLKVSYTKFYITGLCNKLNLRTDYLRWAYNDRIQGCTHPYFTFCKYAFIFDIEAKTKILKIDHIYQVQQFTHSETETTDELRSPSSFGEMDLIHNEYVVLTVSRQNLVESAIEGLSHFSEYDCKKPLKIRFEGEDAEDAGGVKKEFFMLFIKEVLDPSFGMFINFDTMYVMWFNGDSFEDISKFYFIGYICGLAVYNSIMIDLPFPLALYKKLLDEPVNYEDLYPTVVKSFEELLAYDKPDFSDVFNLTFEITQDVYGDIRTVPLKPDGMNIPVTQENKHEFINLYVDMVLNLRVDQQFKAFKNGFLHVCEGPALRLFRSQELMAVLIGNQDYDWLELEKNAIYKHGYTHIDPTIKLFWEVFYEFDVEHKKKFLFFLTGTDRVPVMGIKAIKIFIQPNPDDNYLPVAHTCFNTLDLPKYTSKELLRQKLTQAIHQTEGFSLI